MHHRLFVSVLLAAFPVLLSPPSAQASERLVEIGTLHGKLRYNVELFHVKPGERVRLVLSNTDEMQHNLLICTPGETVTMKVAQTAWTMGAAAMERHFVPDMPEVLHATKILNPGQTEILVFTAPSTPDDYPYVCTIPGHAFTMKGIMRVTENIPAVASVPVEVEEERRRGGDRPEFHQHVMDRPLVKRAFVQNGPARAILVGLPGGVNFCFDADTCSVTFGWFGMFLDVGPDWGSHPGHRGGQPVRTLGDRFDVGAVDLPVRISSPDLTPEVEFQGYEWDGREVPRFHYRVNGAPVYQTIRPAPSGVGLQYDFEFQQINAPVFIHIDDANVNVSSTAGTWKDGWLSVPHDQASQFSVTVTSKTPGSIN